MKSGFGIDKLEKLKLKREITSIFKEGKHLYAGNFRLIWNFALFEMPYPVRFGVSVPKRNIKSSVKRNLMKRRMREVYRLNKHLFFSELENLNLQIIVMFVFKGEAPISLPKVESDFLLAFQKLTKRINETPKPKLQVK